MNRVQRIKEFWNERAIQYGANQEATLGEIAVKCLEINEIKKYLDHGQKILDVGCGNGYTTKIFAKKLFIGAGPIQTSNIIINSMNKERNLNLAESQNYFVPCFYYGKDFDSNVNNQTAGDAEIISSKNIKHNIGPLFFAIKYDQKLLKIFSLEQKNLYFLVYLLGHQRLFFLMGKMHIVQ